MRLERIADATIPKATRKDLFIQGNGYKVGDIMQATLRIYRERNYQVKDFAPYLQGETLRQTCRNIWLFVRKNIAYKKDPGGDQWVRRPSRLWEDKEGDCKSYSVFTASCLHWLGINGVFRFVSYNPEDDTPTHVYVVVPDGNNEIVIDCVPEIKKFGQEANYTSKRDYSMNRLMELAGIGNTADTVSPEVKHVLDLMQAVISERILEAKANGGWITEQRENQYQQAFAKLQSQLRSLMNSRVSGAADDLAAVANYAGIPGAGVFSSVLTSILGNKPNPNDWKGWTPGDVKQWTVNDGDSVSNEAINIISYINAHGLKDITDSDEYGRNRVTIAQIASKLQRGGFPSQAQALLNGGSTNTTTGNGIPRITNTANDINNGGAGAGMGGNTLLLVGVAAVVAIVLMSGKKQRA
jgi:hypothetical protein